MIITTKTGDHGTTSLYTGERVEKDDLRIELNGEMDELNALLGLCKAQSGEREPFESLQRQLTNIMTGTPNLTVHLSPQNNSYTFLCIGFLYGCNEIKAHFLAETIKMFAVLHFYISNSVFYFSID